VRTVHQIVRSPWWSGFAGGLSISFSLLGQAALVRSLPHAPWAPLVTSLGYSVGFLIVILARQQLFAEPTITVVLPVFAEFSRRRRFARLPGPKAVFVFKWPGLALRMPLGAGSETSQVGGRRGLGAIGE
jgi:Formate/nitrite transporter